MLVFYVVVSTLCFLSECYQLRNDSPTCIKMREHVVECSGIDNPDTLRKTYLKLLKSEYSSKTGKVNKFDISKSYFSYIPHDLLKGHDNLYIIEIRDTTLISLSDTDTAFVGAEKEVWKFEMRHCVLFGDFDWYQLRNMTQLEEIELTDIGLKYIDIDANFPHSFNLKVLALNYNSISYISDQGFSKFVNLENLDLMDSNISKLKRSMFPNLLVRIDLSSNKISSLPSDLFTNMPNLIVLNLDKNGFQTLDQTLFAHIWKNLLVFNIADNPLSCDCRIKWILLHPFPGKRFSGKCVEPNELKERYLGSLEDLELWCF
ncbi:carboxypeptidase N subunit 2-like [Parasteatoda tepidariorum]|uniref:carboxypeptidase N subunit 2-like n=1 Tax=Parasteatoda tepidariorum TaxID=114398 RepID=UPI00077FB963|nr:slit homolog 1 protein-like isoform X1 [Parasteatoda tepidariorum]